jgi:hypothetical protein
MNASKVMMFGLLRTHRIFLLAGLIGDARRMVLAGEGVVQGTKAVNVVGVVPLFSGLTGLCAGFGAARGASGMGEHHRGGEQ